MRTNPELFRQLRVHRFNHLPQPVPQRDAPTGFRCTRIAARWCEQVQRVLRAQRLGKRCADVPLVPQHHEVVVPTEQFGGKGDIMRRGRGKHVVADHPAKRDQQMQFVAKDRLLLGRYLAKVRSPRPPASGIVRPRHEMKSDHGHGQTVHHALPVMGRGERGEHATAQGATPAVETGTIRLVGKKIAMPCPLTNVFGFAVPAQTLADHKHGEQFAVAARRLLTARLEGGGQGVVVIVNRHVQHQAQVREVRYHHGVLRWRGMDSAPKPYACRGTPSTRT